MNNRAQRVGVVTACTTFGLLLRLWNIRWGGPSIFHGGEATLYTEAANQVQAGGGLSGAPFGLLKLLHLGNTFILNQIFGTPLEAVSASGVTPGIIPADQFGYITLSRVLVAIIGALVVGLVAATAIRATLRVSSGVVAGLFAAVLPIHVVYSHIVDPAVLVSCAMACVLFIASGVVRKGVTISRLVGSGLAIGIALAAAPTGLLVVIPALAALAVSKHRWFARLGTGVLVLGLGGVVFLGLTPGATSNLTGFAALVREGLPSLGVGPVGAPFIALLQGEGAGPYILAVALLGAPLLGLSAVRERMAGMALVAWLATLVPIAWMIFFDADRSVLVIAAPGLAVLGGLTVRGLAVATNWRVIRASAYVALAVAALPAAFEAGSATRALTHTRTDVLAAQWVRVHVPAESLLVRESGGPLLYSERITVVPDQTPLPNLRDYATPDRPDYVVFRHAGPLPYAQTVVDPISTPGHVEEIVELGYPLIACIGPAPADGVTGHEVWIFAQSERARGRHEGAAAVFGNCSYPTE